MFGSQLDELGNCDLVGRGEPVGLNFKVSRDHTLPSVVLSLCLMLVDQMEALSYCCNTVSVYFQVSHHDHQRLGL